MYLHIGNQKNIRKKQMIGIFDTDNATVSETTRRFLKINEKEGRVSSAITEIPKSFVLYNGLSSDSYARASEKNKRYSKKIRIPVNTQKKKCSKKASKRIMTEEEDAFTASVCFSQLSSASLVGRFEGKE